MMDVLMPLPGRTKKLRDDFDTHTAAVTGIHGAVAAPTAGKLVIRDANGRAQFADPAAAADAATKGWADTAIAALPRVTTVSSGAGLEGGPITSTGTLSLSETGVVAGTYGNATVEVDVHGRIVSISGGSGPGAASTSTAGVVELATDAETAAGSDLFRAVTPASAVATFLKRANNLSDLSNTSTARSNLDVYSRGEVSAGDNARMLKSANLSDVSHAATARANLSVWSRAEADGRFASSSSPSFSGNVYLDNADENGQFLYFRDSQAPTSQFGYLSYKSDSNEMVLFNETGPLKFYHESNIRAETRDVSFHVFGTLTESSSRRWKKNIKPLAVDLERFMRLKPSEYDTEDDSVLGAKHDEDKHTVGFVAEEIAESHPAAAVFARDKTGKLTGEVDGFAPSKILTETVAVVQHLITRVSALEAQPGAK